MKVSVETRLPCTPDVVWSHIRTTKLVKYISYPFMMFEPIDPIEFPEEWHEGEYKVAIQFLDLIPSGEHTLVISNPKCDETPECQEYQIRDNGFGDSAKKWDHLITIKADNGETILRDEIEIDAGPLTPAVAAYAKAFYSYRQARWRQLVENNFDFESGFIPNILEKLPVVSKFIPRVADHNVNSFKASLEGNKWFNRIIS